jgi:hypothetical protein
MKKLASLFVFVTAVAWTLPSAQAAVAGKVILAKGEVTAVRDGREIRLTPGAEIHDRDVLTTGEASNLQVRFNDESIIALKERSQLQIEEYRFSGSGTTGESAFFRLLKGGFRTITGLIGRKDPGNYKVRTIAATIGIRGTMYALVQCQKDCRNADGSPAADGIYGSVLGPSHGTDKLSATNNAGEFILALNQHFHVADENSRPTFLLEPPDFLQDRLGSGKPEGLSEVSPVSKEGAVGDSRPSAWPSLLLAAIDPPLNPTSPGNYFGGSGPGALPPAGTSNVQPNGLPGPISVSASQIDFQPVGGAGIIRGQLVWLTNADMDLHMIAPNNAHVFFGNPSVVLPGGATAALDADNLGGVINVAPDKRIENIQVSGATPPVGTYTFFVRNFSGVTTASTLTVTGDGGVTGRIHSVPALSSGQQSQNFQVIFNGPSAAPGYSP